MKTYLSAFLLFRLLVDQFLLATASIPSAIRGFMTGTKTRPSVDKGQNEQSKSKPTNDFNNLPTQTPNAAPPMQIEGLSILKQYLSNFGYLQSSGSGPFNDSLDQETKSAIKTYQQYFNLPATGDLNNETKNQISLLRCDVPDVNFYYNFTNNTSWPKAGNRWFPKGKNLTYGFLPESQIPDNMTKVFRDSFTRWAPATGVLNLTETTYDDADIKVGFYNFTFLDIDVEVLGSSIIILQPGSNVTTGEILLDGTKFWLLPSESDSLSWEDEFLDLESAAMHQIGHLLGLDHSNENNSVMYPYLLPSQQRKVQLSDSDKNNIQQQYTNANSGHGGRWGVLLFTTFSLGFAHVLLFY